MNIELYEEQVATVYITLEGEADVYKVYGGTSKGQFHTEVGDDDMHWEIYVPAESTAGCSVPRYDIFAKRVSTGQEWRILSGKIATKKRQSQVEGECVSPVEYHVTLPIVEDMVIVDGGQVLIGIKGDKGERGVSAYELAVQNGFEGDEREFTNMMACVQTYAEQAQKSSTDAYDAQILSETSAINALQSAQDAKDAAENIEAPDLTPEAIQAVAPIAWGTWNDVPKATSYLSFALGSEASASDYSTALGSNANATSRSVAVGYKTKASGRYATAIGNTSEATSSVSITIGSSFEDTSGAYKCQTQGTGSITIGAGANTLNTTQVVNGKETTVESSNAVTIGCKAENKGADSVVIGAQASTAGEGTIIIGAGASLAAGTGTISNAILIGRGAKSTGAYAGGSLCIGASATIKGDAAAALGARAVAATGGFALGTAAAAGEYSTAIGYECQNTNIGTTSFKQRKNGGQTYTQFYIMAAESALAAEYEDGEACMGYVVKNVTTGELLAAGTQKLSVLFPNNSTFAPASLDENGEWVAPKVFHPSDLDLPSEEPSEVEEYTPLPVYPIVEPEIEEEIE